MRLFTVGPVEMFERTLDVRSKQIPYFRTDDFSKVMLENADRLKRVLETDVSSKCAFLTASGSAAMEAVVMNSFDQSDHLLIIDGGSFGHRFTQICDVYDISYDKITLRYDEALTEKHFEQFENIAFTACLVNIHETSTGQLYDIHMIQEFCKRKNMILVVDAISSFLSDPLHMDEQGIDCVILSSQKALSLAPGLSMVVMNHDFYTYKVKDKPMKSLYLDLNEHIKNMERGQTPNTPAVGICFELLDMLRYVEEVGKETIIQETRKRALLFRKLIKDVGAELPKFPLSNTLTPIIFNDESAYKVYEYLKNKYDIYVTPSGGALKDLIIRVGHIGNMKTEYYEDLIQKMREVL